MAKFEHAPANAGKVDGALVENAFDFLKRKVPSPIQFYMPAIEPHSGGSCSALTLELIQKIYDFVFEPGFSDVARKAVEGLLVEIKDVEGVKTFRSRQMALNSFEIKGKYNKDTISSDKVAAIASLYNLSVARSSPKVEVASLDKRGLESLLIEMSMGVHLVRLVKPNDGEKLEDYGHTTLFIQNCDHGFYFDVNCGLFALKCSPYSAAERSKLTDLIYDNLQANLADFKLTEFQIHQLDCSTTIT
ncbi:MAG: hypothetical protein AB7F31_06830 [Parachlamydiales bacterium]